MKIPSCIGECHSRFWEQFWFYISHLPAYTFSHLLPQQWIDAFVIFFLPLDVALGLLYKWTNMKLYLCSGVYCSGEATDLFWIWEYRKNEKAIWRRTKGICVRQIESVQLLLGANSSYYVAGGYRYGCKNWNPIRTNCCCFYFQSNERNFVASRTYAPNNGAALLRYPFEDSELYRCCKMEIFANFADNLIFFFPPIGSQQYMNSFGLWRWYYWVLECVN